MASYPLKITAKVAECPGAASIAFAVPQDLRDAFDHEPGQFITLIREFEGEPIARQYSLSSLAGDRGGLRITVRKIDGGRMSSWLVDEASVDDLVDVEVPRGRFFVPLDGAHRVLLLAAGSGVAPMLPIARALLDAGAGHRVALVHGSRTSDSIILADEARQLAQAWPNVLEVDQVLSRADDEWTGYRGRIDRAFLEGGFARWHAPFAHLPVAAWLCGPEPFMDAAEAFLVEQGIELSKIRRESFDLVIEDDVNEPGLIVRGTKGAGELGSATKITAFHMGEEAVVVPQPGETILAALLRSELDVPFSCQEGTCSSCIAKIKDGSVEVRPSALKTLRQDDLDEGLVLACLARPLSAETVFDFDDI